MPRTGLVLLATAAVMAMATTVTVILMFKRVKEYLDRRPLCQGDQPDFEDELGRNWCGAGRQSASAGRDLHRSEACS